MKTRINKIKKLGFEDVKFLKRCDSCLDNFGNPSPLKLCIYCNELGNLWKIKSTVVPTLESKGCVKYNTIINYEKFVSPS
jgi:hypothetical protein